MLFYLYPSPTLIAYPLNKIHERLLVNFAIHEYVLRLAVSYFLWPGNSFIRRDINSHVHVKV